MCFPAQLQTGADAEMTFSQRRSIEKWSNHARIIYLVITATQLRQDGLRDVKQRMRTWLRPLHMRFMHRSKCMVMCMFRCARLLAVNFPDETANTSWSWRYQRMTVLRNGFEKVIISPKKCVMYPRRVELTGWSWPAGSSIPRTPIVANNPRSMQVPA